LPPRVAGALQAIGGLAQTAAGAALLETPAFPLGGLLIWLGVDNIGAGVNTAITGERTATITNGMLSAGLRKFGGLNDEQAQGLANGIEIGINVGADMAAAGALAAAPARVPGQIGYGSSDLSRAAQAYRQRAGVTAGRNVAVFEYRAADGSLQTIARASEWGVGHAERIIARELEGMGVQPSQVTRIYSELQPCVIPEEPAGCARFIRDTFPQAEVTWSFEYGATEASRRAGMAGLRQAAENLGR
jgi:hypothetical protein